jgi:hypothetical protein
VKVRVSVVRKEDNHTEWSYTVFEAEMQETHDGWQTDLKLGSGKSYPLRIEVHPQEIGH